MRASGASISAIDVWDVLKSAVDTSESMGESALGLAPLTQLAGNTPGGTWTNFPERLFDKNLTTNGFPDAVDQYAEQVFGTLCILHDYRIRWSAGNTKETGRWKIQYLSLYGVWTDSVLNIPTVDADAWTEYALIPGQPIASGVRFVMTTYDADSRQIFQLEVRGHKLE